MISREENDVSSVDDDEIKSSSLYQVIELIEPLSRIGEIFGEFSKVS